MAGYNELPGPGYGADTPDWLKKLLGTGGAQAATPSNPLMFAGPTPGSPDGFSPMGTSMGPDTTGFRSPPLPPPRPSQPALSAFTAPQGGGLSGSIPQPPPRPLDIGVPVPPVQQTVNWGDNDNPADFWRGSKSLMAQTNGNVGAPLSIGGSPNMVGPGSWMPDLNTLRDKIPANSLVGRMLAFSNPKPGPSATTPMPTQGLLPQLYGSLFG